MVMDATPDTAALKMVHGWTIHLEQIHDVLASWRATATKFTDYEWATGIDAERALVNVANKIGIPIGDVLIAFGLKGES